MAAPTGMLHFDPRLGVWGRLERRGVAEVRRAVQPVPVCRGGMSGQGFLGCLYAVLPAYMVKTDDHSIPNKRWW
jgi:hypothetical protein